LNRKIQTFEKFEWVKSRHCMWISSNWTGFYAGAHAGAGWSDDNAGFIGGGQVGFNYQINQWVFGVEGDLAGTL